MAVRSIWLHVVEARNRRVVGESAVVVVDTWAREFDGGGEERAKSLTLPKSSNSESKSAKRVAILSSVGGNPMKIFEQV